MKLFTGSEGGKVPKSKFQSSNVKGMPKFKLNKTLTFGFPLNFEL
jgi:hypothetical protein